VRFRGDILKVGVAAGALAFAGGGCRAAPLDRPVRTSAVDTGLGSVEATRRALEGAWTLTSLEAVDPSGAKRSVKASGQLQYDAFGNLTIKGQIDDPALQGSVVIDYTGRIVLDVARHLYYAQGLASDQPVNFDELAAVAPDKVRRYELTADSLVVTYLDASSKPTAISQWRRVSGPPNPPGRPAE